jgi:hypothetical protein
MDVVALIVVPIFIALATAAAVEDWYDKIHSHKRHPVRWKISSRESVIKMMKEEK